MHLQQRDNIDTTPPVRLSHKPSWLKRPLAFSGKQMQIESAISAAGLHTVCVEAKCPNRGECYAAGTATFLVMGTVCTRRCTFCNVTKGNPQELAFDEIERIVAAIKTMALHYVVITSVTRDDLPDGGAFFLASLTTAIRAELPNVQIELLIPDLQGDQNALNTLFSSRPDTLNHNIETVPSLYAIIRPQADYARSLAVLRSAAAAGLKTKSGIMVGLGETIPEVHQVLRDLKAAGCSMVTIGQYLQPSAQHQPVVAYIELVVFEAYAAFGHNIGIGAVTAGPFVRSSYHAAEMAERL